MMEWLNAPISRIDCIFGMTIVLQICLWIFVSQPLWKDKNDKDK